MATDSTLDFPCEICGEKFLSRNKLFRHLKETTKDHTKQVDPGDMDSPARKRLCIGDDSVLSKDSTYKAREKEIKEHADKGLSVVCEDEYYRVISKPQGLATMGTKGVTLWKSDLMLLPDALKLQLPYKKATPCHRLDKETGGVMLCSKSKLMERTIMMSFKCKLVHKKYLAIVIGKMEPEEGTIDAPISGKAALTKYKVSHCTPSAQYGHVTTVQLWPVTGRKHQLRRHLQSIGHSIVGDKRFPMPQLWPTITQTGIPHMFLWAVEIDFPHPRHCTELVDGTDAADAAAVLQKGSDDDDGDDDGALDADLSGNIEEAGAGEGLSGGNRSSGGVSSISEAQRRTLARLRGALQDPALRVVASIPEPAYYATFRAVHQQAWERANAAEEQDGSDTR